MWLTWQSCSSSGTRHTAIPAQQQWRLLLTAALVSALCFWAEPAAAQTASVSAALPSDAMQRFFLNTTDPFAVCNDGTSGAAAASLLHMPCLEGC